VRQGTSKWTKYGSKYGHIRGPTPKADIGKYGQCIEMGVYLGYPKMDQFRVQNPTPKWVQIRTPLLEGPDVCRGLTTCWETSGYGVRKGSILGPLNRAQMGPVLDPPKSQQRI
jgi:hypothetical protein